jgi:hypothetical protein
MLENEFSDIFSFRATRISNTDLIKEHFNNNFIL